MNGYDLAVTGGRHTTTSNAY